MARWWIKLGVVAGLMVAAMCGAAHAEHAGAPAAHADIVILPVKAEVVFVTTHGAEDRPDWSDLAALQLMGALDDALEADGWSSTVALAPTDDPSLEQALLLLEVVADTATSEGRTATELTIGEIAAERIRSAHSARYGWYIDHRADVESSGVRLSSLALGAITGFVPPADDPRRTVATVIDLETGAVIASAQTSAGDARNPSEARAMARTLVRKVSRQMEDAR